VYATGATREEALASAKPALPNSLIDASGNFIGRISASSEAPNREQSIKRIVNILVNQGGMSRKAARRWVQQNML
jgi:hypothetical protein